MSSAQCLREFVTERRTKAAEEIFTVSQKTSVEYEEEIDLVWKPEIKLRRMELQVFKEEFLTWELLCNQDRNSNLDQEEDGEQLVLKQEDHTFMWTPANEHSDHQLLSHGSPVAESPDQTGRENVDPQSSGNTGLQPKKRCHSNVHNSATTKTHKRKKCLTCETCGKTFKYESRLKLHLRVHTGEKPYVCNTCGNNFSYMSALKYHVRIHTGERPCVCNTCGKSFRGNNDLKIHLRTHTGERPCVCKICGKGFNNISALTRHIRSHTGEKPYPCDTCGKGFKCNASRLRHMRSHTDERPYPCEICGNKFRRKGSWLSHMRTHTGEKPYLCNTCGRRFAELCNLKRHGKVHKG